MKFYPKLGIYKASNVYFNPIKIEAYSYNWWTFVKVIKNKIVFNDFRYSPSTQRHQSKIQNLMDEIGIKPDLWIEAPGGLNNLESAIEHYKIKIQELEFDIAKPRTQKAKNEKRREAIKAYKLKIKQVKGLL